MGKWFCSHGPMRKSRACGSRFPKMMAARREGDAVALAEVLSAASPGISEPMWDALPGISAEVLLIAGAPLLKLH